MARPPATSTRHVRDISAAPCLSLADTSLATHLSKQSQPPRPPPVGAAPPLRRDRDAETQTPRPYQRIPFSPSEDATVALATPSLDINVNDYCPGTARKLLPIRRAAHRHLLAPVLRANRRRAVHLVCFRRPRPPSVPLDSLGYGRGGGSRCGASSVVSKAAPEA
jgi:hypothetical protein